MTPKTFFVIGYMSFVLGLFVVPFVASANMPNIWPSGFWGPLVSCTGTGGNGFPACKSLCDIIQTLENILAFAESIALFIAAPVLFAWGGIVILTAGGNPGKLETGKKIFTGTLIGVLITLGAYLIIATFINVFGVGNLIQGFTTSFNCKA